MEIERKFLIKNCPENLDEYPYIDMEQGYLSIDPVVRIRRENEDFFLTYKSKGLLSREEYNLPLNKESFAHLLTKIDGYLIRKRRYLIPFSDSLTIELDIFEEQLSPLQLVEVEFPDEETALSFTPPHWFGKEVTYETAYHNSNLSQQQNYITRE